jgi:very-short-patch-repair endonuclease
MGWRIDEPVEVVVATGSSPPRTTGVRGRRLAPDRIETREIHGLALLDPIATVFASAAGLTHRQTAVMVEALIATARNYPGKRDDCPPATVAMIHRRLLEWGRFPGCGKLRAALEIVREGAESPKETETRLLLRDFHLPEPVVQHTVVVDGRFVARTDLAYPEWRIAIEYEGDHHRTDRDQWRADIRRQRDLEDNGWIVIRVTQLDLAEGGAALAARVRRAIASRR